MLENFLFELRSPLGIQIFSTITFFGSAFAALTIVGFLLAMCVCKKHWHKAAGIFIGFVVAEGITALLKLLFHRPRPELFPPAVFETSFSFPSGHATTAAFVFGLIGYYAFLHWKTKKTRVLAIFCVVLAIFLIDLSRLYLGVHYLRDVIAGNIIGFLGLGIVVAMDRCLYRVRNKPIAYSD